MSISDNTICRNCGITFKSAHMSYDGYRSPNILTECVKKREKCSNPYCIPCTLKGGHIVEYYSTGRHKWE